MNPDYEAWIKEMFPTPESADGACAEATALMAARFPELTRVRGHVWCSAGVDRPHWWLVAPGGNIIDPTKHQWAWLGEYMPRDESQPEPTGKCPNCGGECFGGSTLCSESCEVSYRAYCMGGAL